MLKKILIASAICCTIVPSFAQKDSTKKSKTTFTAYVDGYFRGLRKTATVAIIIIPVLPIPTTVFNLVWQVLKWIKHLENLQPRLI